MMLMMKLQISKKMRSLNNVFQTAADHFPDVSNMVVSGFGIVTEILKMHRSLLNIIMHQSISTYKIIIGNY